MTFRFLAIAIVVLAWTINLSGQKDDSSTLSKDEERNRCSLKVIFPYIGEQATTPQEHSAKGETPDWYARPEWWLLILGIPTLGGILWQANETKRAAQAARDSIRLQEKAMAQWVGYRGWTHQIETLQQSTVLGVSFEIYNPTSFPLTISSANVRFTLLSREWQDYPLREDCVLRPDGPERVGVLFPLYESEAERYKEIGLIVQVDVDLTYRGVLNKPEPDIFRMILSCDRNGTRFYEDAPKKPENQPAN